MTSTVLEKSEHVRQACAQLIQQGRSATESAASFLRNSGLNPDDLKRLASDGESSGLQGEISQRLDEIRHDIDRDTALRRAAANPAASSGVGASRPRRLV